MYWAGTKQRFALATGLLLLSLGVSSGCATPQGVLFPSIEPPHVWPPSPDAPRVRLVGALADSRDLQPGRSAIEALRVVFRGPRPPIRFSSPHSVSIGPADLIAVADGTGGVVHIMDLDSREHCVVSGFGDQRFAVPLGVAWAGTRLFVTDAKRAEVVELDAQGGFRGRFGQDVLVRPVGIAHVAGRDQLCVVDGGDHALKLFDLAGTFIGTIGHRGAGPGEFNFPTHVCCTGNRLLVSDTGNFRVQLLDLDGKCLRTIGRKGDGAGDFSLPKGVAVDSEGHIYVVDAQFENVQVFQEAGHLLMAFGEEGNAPGRFSLPAGLAIDNKDRIWVADSGNRRLQVFACIMRTSS